MAARTETYTTRIFLNAEEAKNQLKELQSKVEDLRKKKEAAASAGNWEDFNKIKRQLDDTVKEADKLSNSSARVSKTLDNLSTASVKEINKTIKAINAELKSGAIERGSEEWNFLNEQLARCNEELRKIRNESKMVSETGMKDFLEDFNRFGFAINNIFGIGGGISGLLNNVKSLTDEGIAMAQAAEGVSEAFERINQPNLLDKLREATHNTVNDLELMKQAVKFKDFNLPVEQLGTYLSFAQQKAKDTGESIDYLVNSIVTGLGRQSPLILDNLGLSAKQISDEAKRSGDFFGAVAKIIEQRMSTAGKYVETSMDRAAQATVRLENAQMEVGKLLIPLKERSGELYTSIRIGSLEAVKFVIQHASAFKELAIAAGLVVAVYKSQVIWLKLVAAWTTACSVGSKALAASWALLRSAGIALNAVFAVCTLRMNAYRAAMRLAHMASLPNPWYALATALTVVGVAIYGIVKASGSGAKALSQLSAAEVQAKMKADDLKRIQNDVSQSIVAQQQKVEQLTGIVKNSTLATKDRLKAARELQNFIPGYNATLDTEGVQFKKNEKAVRDYIAALDELALARAINKKLEERASKQIDIDKSISTWTKAVDLRTKKLKDLKKVQDETLTNGVGNGAAAFTPTMIGNAYQNNLEDVIKASEETLKYDQSRLRWWQTRDAANKAEIEWLKKYRDQKVSAENQIRALSDSNFGSTITNPNPQKDKPTTDKKDPNEERAKKFKAQLDAELLAETSRYEQGLVNYRQYLLNMLRIREEDIERRKGFFKEDTEQYANAIKDELALMKDRSETKKKYDEADIEHERQMTALRLKYQFYNDPSSEVFQNQEALNEALFMNEYSAMLDRINLYKEGNEKRVELEGELDKMLEQNQLQHTIDAYKNLEQIRRQYQKLSLEEREKLELESLERTFVILKNEGLMNQEEYEKLRTEISLKYEDLRLRNTKKYSEEAKKALERATLAEGSVNQIGGDTLVSSVFNFGTAISSFIKTREQLKQQYEQGKIDYQQYMDSLEMLSAEKWDNIRNAAAAALSGISNILGGISAYARACSDLEVATIKKNYDKQIEAAGNNSRKRQKLEKERDKKIAKAKTDANKKAVKIQIAQALAQTAVNALHAYGAVLLPGVPWTFPLAIAAAGMATAAGLLQVATIKKQAEAQEAGYYEGGYTGGKRYRKEAGVVHEGEFVANHQAVNNPNIRPMLDFIDLAQRNNTVGGLTRYDIARNFGVAEPTVVAPVVNVNTDNERMESSLNKLDGSIDKLNSQLEKGIKPIFVLDEFEKEYKHYQNIKNR